MVKTWDSRRGVDESADQCQISPAASSEFSHHTVWRTWLLIAYSHMKDDYTTNSHYLTYTFLFKNWEDVLFELWDLNIGSNEVFYCSARVAGSAIVFNVTKETPPHQALREPWELLIFSFLGYFFSLQVDSMLAIFERLQWLFMLT